MTKANIDRRRFLVKCAAVSSTAWLANWAPCHVAAGETPQAEWLAMLEDPAYSMAPGAPNLDRILSLFPRPTGKPAFDPQLIAENVRRLQPVPAVDTGHPLLDLSVKTGLAHSSPSGAALTEVGHHQLKDERS